MLALEGMAQQSSGASVLSDDVDDVSLEDEAPSLDAFRFAREISSAACEGNLALEEYLSGPVGPQAVYQEGSWVL